MTPFPFLFCYHFSLTGELLGKIMFLLLQDNDFGKASEIMEKLDKGHGTIVGVPKFETLSLFVDKCIEEKTPSRAIVGTSPLLNEIVLFLIEFQTCIQYCADSGFPDAKILAAKLDEKLTLNEEHLKSLSKIVGDFDVGSRANVVVE